MVDNNDSSPENRLSVADAAEQLGLTEDAIRKRIHRGHIAYEQDSNGRYWVYLNQTNQTDRTDRQTVHTALQYNT
jgi:excisionase family DNA binding protein